MKIISAVFINNKSYESNLYISDIFPQMFFINDGKSLVLYISSFEINVNLNKPLENCTQKEFFTVETIKETNNVNELFLKSSYYMLAITKIKHKNFFFFASSVITLR